MWHSTLLITTENDQAITEGRQLLLNYTVYAQIFEVYSYVILQIAQIKNFVILFLKIPCPLKFALVILLNDYAW